MTGRSEHGATHLGVPVDGVDRSAVQKRAVRVLTGSVAAGGAAMAAAFSSVAVLAEEITGSDTLAGLAAAALSTGSALGTLPVARRMADRGRRSGLAAGWTAAMVGGAIGFAAAVTDVYVLLVIGAVLIGVGNATNLAARYGAADLALDNERARAIGLLVWAGLFGSALGPTIALGPAGAGAEALSLPELSGPYLMAIAGFGGAVLFVDRRLRPDPLLVARSLEPERTEPRSRPAVRRILRDIGAEPRARLAVFGMVVGQATMVGIMTMTPLHMKDGDHELRVIGLVISLHVVGMYALAPLVGWIVDRIGPHLVIAAAGVVLFCGAELAAHTDPEDSAGVFTGLFLVGLGWSFGLIAGSALLTSAFEPARRVVVQGGADLVMVSAGAAAGLSSGLIVEVTSFHSLSHWAGLASLTLVVAALAPVITDRFGPRRQSRRASRASSISTSTT